MKEDFIYMQRCLYLAELGRGSTAPNPMVGCVIVYKGNIIGEGYHRKCGEAHAEVNAIESVDDKSLLTESTLYVNLEPCAYHGKTPPCSNLIVEHKLKRVVVGCIDSFSKVAGKGIEQMRKHGIDVTVGILENESRTLNNRFFTFHEKKRPYIILKWAETQDCFVDIADHMKKETKGLWITNDLSRILVHKWRTEEQSILVGTITAEKDNPQLNAREWKGTNPTRIVLDKNSRLPKTLHLFDGSIPTYVFTEQHREDTTNLYYCTIDFNDLWNEVFTHLHRLDIQSVIIEGGSIVHNSLIKQNLWDEARVFIGNKFFKEGTAAPKLRTEYYKEEWIDGVRLLWFRNEG